MASARAAERWIPRDASLQAFSFMSTEFDEEPEEPYISKTIEQTGAELHRVDVGARRLWDNLDRFTWFQDEPVHSLAAMVSYEVYGLAAANGVKVVLSGSGSDEVIAGYPNYFADYWGALLQGVRLRRLWREIDSFSRVHGRARGEMLRRTLRHFCGSQLRRARPYRAPGWSPAAGGAAGEPLVHPRSPCDRLRTSHELGRESRRLSAMVGGALAASTLPAYRRPQLDGAFRGGTSPLSGLPPRINGLPAPPDWKLRGPWNKYVLGRRCAAASQTPCAPCRQDGLCHSRSAGFVPRSTSPCKTCWPVSVRAVGACITWTRFAVTSRSTAKWRRRRRCAVHGRAAGELADPR